MRTYPATLTLTDEYDTITIRTPTPSAADPVICKQWDLGAPEARGVSVPRMTADGDIDRSGFVGGRTVTMELVVRGDAGTVSGGKSAYDYADRLTAMTHPTRRPVLQITRANPEAYGDTWELVLRGNPFSISYGPRAASLLELQLSFTAPLGLLEGPLREASSSGVTADLGTSGFVFPIVFPIELGNASVAVPVANLTLGGAAPVAPIIYIHGPSTDPEIRTDNGEVFKFDGLTLASGQFVAINMGEGTVTIGGNPDASVFHLVDFTESTFWQWLPGAHAVRLHAAGGSITVQWRERRMSI